MMIKRAVANTGAASKIPNQGVRQLNNGCNNERDEAYDETENQPTAKKCIPKLINLLSSGTLIWRRLPVTHATEIILVRDS